MGKKILICEDSEIFVESFSVMCKEYGYVPVILAKEGKPKYVLDNVEKIVINEQPECAVVDGLDRLWIEVIEKIKKKKPDVLAILYTGRESLVCVAREKGYNAFSKSDEPEQMFNFIKSQIG